jgi:hypothetical protein
VFARERFGTCAAHTTRWRLLASPGTITIAESLTFPKVHPPPQNRVENAHLPTERLFIQFLLNWRRILEAA